MSLIRSAMNAFAVGFRAGIGVEKGDALWHGKSGEKADWIPTTSVDTVIPPTPPVGW